MEESKNHTWRCDTTWRLREAATKGLMIVMAISLAALLTLVYRQLFRADGILRGEYEGKIVDKSLTIQETQTGSKMKRRLLIEGKRGERFEVAPDVAIYERAQIGMWIKSDRAGVELSRSESGGSPAVEGKKD
jgi:hypothetical protein